MEIKVIKSRRRSMALQVKEDGTIICRVPMFASNAEVQAFLKAHEDWLINAHQKALSRLKSLSGVKKLTQTQLNELADRAAEYIPKRTAYYASLLNVTYGRITIRCQKTRWGSCSAKGNLNFNCLLMLAPTEVVDSVIVHELCHRLEMNHSKLFYSHVYSVFPDYDRCHKWLTENGDRLMALKP